MNKAKRVHSSSGPLSIFKSQSLFSLSALAGDGHGIEAHRLTWIPFIFAGGVAAVKFLFPPKPECPSLTRHRRWQLNPVNQHKAAAAAELSLSSGSG